MLFTPSGATVSQRQSFIAFYQFSPFFVYVIIQTFSSFLDKAPARTKNADIKLVKAAYALSGIWSGLAYITTLLIAVFSSDPSVSISSIFLPSFRAVANASPETHIQEGSFLFMKIDYWIVWLACVVYASKTAQMMWMGGPIKMRDLHGLNGSVIIAGIMIGFAMCFFGPGAVVGGILYTRESKLREWFDEEGIKQKSNVILNGEDEI